MLFESVESVPISHTAEYKRELVRRWREANPERFRAIKHEYAHSDRGKEVARKNRKDYYARNTEVCKQKMTERYYRNRYGDCFEGYVPLKNIADDVFTRDYYVTKKRTKSPLRAC